MKKWIFALLLLFIAATQYAVSIDHFSPQTYPFGSDVDLRVNVVDGFDNLSGIKIVWKRTTETIWRKEEMKLEATGAYWFIGKLFSRDLQDYDIEYYFELSLKDGTVQNVPELDSAQPKYKLMPGTVSGEEIEGFVLLSESENPRPGQEYILAVSYYALVGRIDLRSIKLFVGGRDVTNRAEITENALVYKDSSPTPGSRKAMVSAVVDGRSVHSPIWTTVIPRKPNTTFLPLNLRGNFNFISNVYDLSTEDNASDILESVDDATGRLDLYSTYGKLNMQANLLVSSIEDSNSQPVNRYTLGFQLPVLDVFFGDSNPTFSQFTLGNKNVRGLYAKFHTRFLSLSWIHGEMVRATKNSFEDLAGNIRNTGTFKQEAIGARFQMGNDQGFKLGFTLTRNRDIISSLDPDDYSYMAAGDTIYTALPQDNAVVAVDARLAVPDQKFVLGIEAAGSLLNKNTLPGALSAADIEEYLDEEIPLNIEPADLADIFVINTNMEPLTPGREMMAWQAYIRTYILNNLIDARYVETGPVFNAYSTYYQQKDTKLISITDQFNIKNIVILNGGVNLMEDNLSGHKTETSKTNSWFAQATLRIPRYPYLKASYFNNDMTNEPNDDISDPGFIFNPYERNSNTLSIGMGYNFTQIPFVPSSLDISYRMGADDSNTNDVMNYENRNNSLNISLSNKYSILPLRTQLVFALQNSNRDTSSDAVVYPLYDNSTFNFQFGADYTLLNKKLRPYIQYKLLSLSGDQGDQGFNYFTLGLEAFPIRDMTVGTELSVQSYGNDADSTEDYSKLTWRFTLNQRF